MNHVLLENKEINKTHKINEIKRPNDKVNSVCQSECLVNPCPLVGQGFFYVKNTSKTDDLKKYGIRKSF